MVTDSQAMLKKKNCASYRKFVYAYLESKRALFLGQWLFDFLEAKSDGGEQYRLYLQYYHKRT